MAQQGRHDDAAHNGRVIDNQHANFIFWRNHLIHKGGMKAEL